MGQSLIVHAKIVLKAIVDSQHGFGCPMVNVQSVLGVDIHFTPMDGLMLNMNRVNIDSGH